MQPVQVADTLWCPAQHARQSHPLWEAAFTQILHQRSKVVACPACAETGKRRCIKKRNLQQATGHFFSGNCPLTSMALVIIPMMPTAASCSSYVLERCSIWHTRSTCLAKVSMSLLLFALLSSGISAIFLRESTAPRKLDMQKNLSPS